MRTSTPSVFRWLSGGGVRGATRNARRAIEHRERDQTQLAGLEARLAAQSPLSLEEQRKAAR